MGGRGNVRVCGCVAVWLVTSAQVLAQTPSDKPADTSPPKPPDPVVAIVGGDIWTVTKGVVKGGTVIIKGTKID